MTGGRKPRYEYYELFDAGNVDNDGTVLSLDSPRNTTAREMVSFMLIALSIRGDHITLCFEQQSYHPQSQAETPSLQIRELPSTVFPTS